MGFLSKLKHLELLLTPTAPKKGSVPLPEVDELIVYPVNLSAAGEEDGSAGSDYTSSPPATPFFRRRFGSLLSRSSTPKHDSRPATPLKPSSPPVLVAPTPRWKTPPSLREQGWKNVSPGPEPELKARTRSNSMQYPPRPSTTRPSERSLSPEVLKAKQRPMTPQVPPRSPESVDRRTCPQTPDVLKHAFPTTTQSPLRPSSSRPSTTTLCDDRTDSPYAKARVTRSASRPSAPTSPSPRGILKPRSPTPDDSAVMPFREPSTPPSSPSPPMPLPSHSFGLHWQLLPPNPAMGKYLRFDMALPVAEIRKYTNGIPFALGSRDLSKSAVEGLQLTRMTIRCARLQHWDIVAKNPQGVTCGDVFEAIHRSLDTPLTGAELALCVPDRRRDRIQAAFAQRCKDAPGLDEYVRKQGLMRIDLLQGRRVFAGLKLFREDRCDLWELSTT